MSILYLRARPIVAFNENNPLHRQYFHEFKQKRGWGTCPVRFMVESLNTSLVDYISERMLDYYVDQEFNKTVNTKKVAAKKPKQSKLNKNGK